MRKVYILLLAIAIVVAFFIGRYSVLPIATDVIASGLTDPFEVTGRLASETALSSLMPPDTTQSVLVFAFSLNCPNCWDSVETIKSYRRSGTVDSIVGVTFGTPTEVDSFSKQFDVDFPIHIIPLRELTAITMTVPRIFVVKEGRVMATFTAPVMSFRTFNDHYSIGP